MKDSRRNGRRIKRPASWYLTWAILDFIIIFILFGFIGSLPVWRIRKLEIIGNNYVSNEKISSIAKIRMEENIFLLDKEEVSGRFADIIQIKRVSVKRKYPGTVVIDITERKPFAIAVIGDKATLIDDEGFIIAKQSLDSSIYKSDIAKLPVVRGISVRSLEEGRRIGRLDRTFMRNTIDILSRSLDTGKIQIELNNADGIVIYVDDILKAKIGGAGDIEKKITALAAMFNSVKDKVQKIAYMDVSVPDSPVIKFK